ncbi:hypothetical protein B0H14DRAFT_2608648 [Mycena olivaceomarginata]|nr:hypothetical protein B0H14DRAFT_2608648 [Mycena olivaceomarginata]
MFKILPLLLLACVLASSRAAPIVGREIVDFRSNSAAASEGASADPLKHLDALNAHSLESRGYKTREASKERYDYYCRVYFCKSLSLPLPRPAPDLCVTREKLENDTARILIPQVAALDAGRG